MTTTEKFHLEGECYDDAASVFTGLEDHLFNCLPWQCYDEANKNKPISIEGLYLDVSEHQFKYVAGAYLMERLDAFWQRFVEVSKEAA